VNERKQIEQFDLRSKLRFCIDRGQIWLGENRMLLLHAKAMGRLRKELFESLGKHRARGVLVRSGFEAGQQDAELALKLYKEGDNYDVFEIGPAVHAFEGIVLPTITESEIDWEEGCFYGKVEMLNSWEAESHKQHFGTTDDMACWSIVGYASGYVTHFFKRLIIFREIQCACGGHDKCIIMGKPAEAWNDDSYLNYFLPEYETDAMHQLQDELESLRGSDHKPSPSTGRLVGRSQGFRSAFDLLSKAANSPINVLLLGETGVGKEVFAQWLHENSDRSDKPFIAINCAAIPPDLLESELFGVKRGAFTGAQESRPGRFERADGGTLLLDEVGDLPPSAQVKLLRVLQSGEVERLGDDCIRKVDVRLVAATNVDMKQAIADGKFRSDLYYRLSTYPVEIPPLRERKSDIPLLAEALIEKFEPVYRKKISGITDRAIDALLTYNWLGNVRELENVIERGVLLAPTCGMIEVEHLFAGNFASEEPGSAVNRQGNVRHPTEESRIQLLDALLDDNFSLQEHEAWLLERAVRRTNGNLTHAAKLLGITRRQLAYRLKKVSDPSE
jgi:DNA-binding NtrC family response regulator/predicted hydrocarbon binding protein